MFTEIMQLLSDPAMYTVVVRGGEIYIQLVG
jgi:hypothetical protein